MADLERPQYEDLPDAPMRDAMLRGRDDHEFFSHYFLRRKLHAGQLKFVTEANATFNILATANRYGKTSIVTHRHVHKCFYKLGAEPQYQNPVTGQSDGTRFLTTRYSTVHTADLSDTVDLAWGDFKETYNNSPRLRVFVKDIRLSPWPVVTFENGSTFRFRTLGGSGEGIDGRSFYHITIDEAGWIEKLTQIVDNVARLRVADVRGQIDLLGTFKPGSGKDFYSYARKAGVYTGTEIAFDHHGDDIERYLKEYGIVREPAQEPG